MTRKRDSILWRLSREDSHFVSYLMGTMHIKDSAAFTHVDKAKKLIDQSFLFAAEFDLDDAAYGNHASDILLPDGGRISNLIGDKKLERITKIFSKAYELNIRDFDRMLPMLIISAISQKILSEDNATSLDQFLWDYATGQGKIMQGIESYQEQLRIMSSIDIDYQMQSLLQALRNTSKFRKKLLDLTKYYEKEEIHKLYKLSKKSLGKYRDLMLFERNVKMSDRIVQLSLDQHCFIAIGAAHLSGKKGVLHLLNQKGMTIKPIH